MIREVIQDKATPKQRYDVTELHGGRQPLNLGP
jgi:hypothetical protein